MFCCSKLLSTNKLPKNKCVVSLFIILNKFSTYWEMMHSQTFVVVGACLFANGYTFSFNNSGNWSVTANLCIFAGSEGSYHYKSMVR